MVLSPREHVQLKEICQMLAHDSLVRVLNQKKYDNFWGAAYRTGENLRKVQKLSTFAVKGKLLEVTRLRDLKRVANQMK